MGCAPLFVVQAQSGRMKRRAGSHRRGLGEQRTGWVIVSSQDGTKRPKKQEEEDGNNNLGNGALGSANLTAKTNKQTNK